MRSSNVGEVNRLANEVAIDRSKLENAQAFEVNRSNVGTQSFASEQSNARSSVGSNTNTVVSSNTQIGRGVITSESSTGRNAVSVTTGLVGVRSASITSSRTRITGTESVRPEASSTRIENRVSSPESARNRLTDISARELAGVRSTGGDVDSNDKSKQIVGLASVIPEVQESIRASEYRFIQNEGSSSLSAAVKKSLGADKSAMFRTSVSEQAADSSSQGNNSAKVFVPTVRLEVSSKTNNVDGGDGIFIAAHYINTNKPIVSTETLIGTNIDALNFDGGRAIHNFVVNEQLEAVQQKTSSELTRIPMAVPATLSGRETFVLNSGDARLNYLNQISNNQTRKPIDVPATLSGDDTIVPSFSVSQTRNTVQTQIKNIGNDAHLKSSVILGPKAKKESKGTFRSFASLRMTVR